LNDIAFLADQVEEIDSQIQKCMIPFRKEENQILTIPGISQTAAAHPRSKLRGMQGAAA
jgi:hypothetical protein